ncbi:MAG: CAP domain-containing protein [Labrys sp. (in: a-proteobacteria)]|jgi:uncharacterized protein YkwD
MRRSALPLVLISTLLLGGCALDMFGTDKPQRRQGMYDSLAGKRVKVDPKAALAMISDYRRGKGLNALRLDPQLTAMAQRQADAMAARGVMSHDVGGSFSSRLAASGIKSVASAENLGAGYYTLADAFSGWRQSPGHNANMLLPEATRFGIATANAPDSKYKVFWAMVVAGEPPKPPVGMVMGSDGPLRAVVTP